MNSRDAKQRYEDLTRRRDIALGLLNQTREKLENMLDAVQRPDADPRDLVTIQLLTFQGRVLVRVMERLADEAAELALTLKRPAIDTSEINVPDTMPEEL